MIYDKEKGEQFVVALMELAIINTIDKLNPDDLKPVTIKTAITIPEELVKSVGNACEKYKFDTETSATFLENVLSNLIATGFYCEIKRLMKKGERK